MENRMPLIGEKFPEMDVVTTQGSKKLPDDYKGKWFVLFSHPGDFTPVCTTEFFSFAQRNDEFTKLNTELIGLSVDSKISHMEWINWIHDNLKIDVKFPIISLSGQFAGVAILYLSTICRALIILRISDIFLPISRG